MFDAVSILFVLTAILLLGLSKGGFGGVGAPVALPIMSLGLPVEFALGVLLPILMTMDAVSVGAHRKNADYKTVAFALPAALAGVLVGAATVSYVSADLVGGLIGVLAVVFAVQALTGIGLAKQALPRWLGAPFGALSGFTSTIAHAGGPPIHIFLLSRAYEQKVFVATSVIFMASVNLLKVIPFIMIGALDWSVMKIAALLMPVAAVAAYAGFQLSKVLPKKAFKIGVNGLMILAGLKLITDAVL